MSETVDKDKTWEWTRKGDLKVDTEALIFAAQAGTGTNNNNTIINLLPVCM